jgi:ABC-type glycerol-3-phosphate transport system substrate-binding protein
MMMMSVFGGGQKEATSTNGITTIKFYGSDGQYNQNIIAGFEKANPDIKVQIIPVDYDNAEQVIKTGIASGNPVDVSFFWGAQVKSFVESNMALDLTDYLTANGNQWKNTFVDKYLDAGKINGRYYAVSYQPVIETLFVNKDLFTQYGLAIPETWDDFLSVCAEFKKHGVYGVGNWVGQNHQLLVFAYQFMANAGVLDDATQGKLPLAGPNETPGLRQTLEMWKDVYDKGYWYPGEGALTATKEQVQAAFYQGKIAMLFDAGSNVGTYQTNAQFDVDVIKFPLVDTQGKYAVNVVTNALFIPSNAKNKEAAVRFIKYYTSDAGEEEIIKSGRLPSTKSMQDSFDNPIMNHLLATTTGSNSVGYQHLQNLSSEMSSYLTNDLISSVCSNTVTIDEALQQVEKLRLQAIGK